MVGFCFYISFGKDGFLKGLGFRDGLCGVLLVKFVLMFRECILVVVGVYVLSKSLILGFFYNVLFCFYLFKKNFWVFVEC